MRSLGVSVGGAYPAFADANTSGRSDDCQRSMSGGIGLLTGELVGRGVGLRNIILVCILVGSQLDVSGLIGQLIES